MNDKVEVELHAALEMIAGRMEKLLPAVVLMDQNGSVSKGFSSAVLDIGNCAKAARARYERERAAAAEQAKADAEQAGSLFGDAAAEVGDQGKENETEE